MLRSPATSYANSNTIQITTRLPGPEDAFEAGESSKTPSLKEILEGSATNFSVLAGSATITALTGRMLHELQRPYDIAEKNNIRGLFWQRLRAIDGNLTNLGMRMPSSLRLRQAAFDPFVANLHMNFHTIIICLHQSMISNAVTHGLPQQVVDESNVRCMTSAAFITNTMRAISHLEVVKVGIWFSTQKSMLC